MSKKLAAYEVDELLKCETAANDLAKRTYRLLEALTGRLDIDEERHMASNALACAIAATHYHDIANLAGASD